MDIVTSRPNRPDGANAVKKEREKKPFFMVLVLLPESQLAKLHRIGGASPETYCNVNYDAPEAVGGDRKCFDSPIRK